MPKGRGSRKDPSEQAAEELVTGFLKLPRGVQVVLACIAAVLILVAVVFVLHNRKSPAPKPRPTATTLPAPSPTSTPLPTLVPTATPASRDLLLGIPSHATGDPANRDDFLLVKPFFALSYNNDNGTPNWVSWRVTRDDLGSASRKPLFDPETMFPAGFKVVTHKDYTGSGFDRGHMCPHADRGANQAESFATFVMSNIIPQAPTVNEKTWADSEEYFRGLVRQGNRLYVVAGPAGRGGRGLNGPAEMIANGRVVVPASCWKVVVVAPERGQPDAANIFTGEERVIGIWMPNDESAIRPGWGQYRVTPATIEQRTGLKFFTALPRAIADRLRTKLDSGTVQ